MTFGMPPRGCWGEGEGMGDTTVAQWHGWRAAVLNPLWLGISYSVLELGSRRKGGWEGELGSDVTGKCVYELIFTSCTVVQSLAL